MSYRLISFLLPVLILSSVLSFAPSVLAAKPRVQKPRISQSVRITFSKARLSRVTHSVVLTFINLDKAAKVTYELSYLTNGLSQGVVGSLTPTGKTTDTRDLYFGTCSHGVCTPHWKITNARLCVRTSLKTGGANRKCYRIKM